MILLEITFGHVVAFFLGFGVASALLVGVFWFWIRKKWMTMLLGFGGSVLGKTIGKFGKKPIDPREIRP